MFRTVLNHFSTAEIVIIFIGGAVVLTTIGVLLARRLFPRLADSHYEPIADSLRVVYELIFALILAFVIAAVLDEMGNAESAVASEATTISELVRANDAFPPDVRGRVDDSVQQYVRAVGIDEWKTMKDGRASPLATSALDGMYAEYRTFEPKGEVQTQAYGQAIDDLHEVTSKRRERLDIAESDLPTILRVLVLVGVVLLLALEYRPQLPLGAGLVFMGTLATVVTAAFLLTVVLNYPFAGDVAVSNEPLMHDNLARYWDKELAYHQKPGDKPEALTAQQLQGVYNSDAYGTLVLTCHDPGPPYKARTCRPGDHEMRGVYRYYDGTLAGDVVNGVFRGWWTQAPSHRRKGDAGRVEWKLMKTSHGSVVAGSWSNLFERMQSGWDLERIGGAANTPIDLAERLASARSFIPAPAASTASSGRAAAAQHG